MSTITGPLNLPWGSNFSGLVTFTPYPDGLARVVDSDVISATQLVATFSNGEPVSALVLTEGSYSVKMPHTAAFLIAVPSGSGTVSIASIVTEGVANPILPSGSGDVSGPSSSVDNTLVRFSGTTGKLLQGGNLILDDNGNLSGVRSITISNGTQTITLSVALVHGIADLVIQ
jgi:hypothetical protein